ncbi:MAG: hypothetical protein QNJ20_11910 [Paracoccaceae bacterium]|nr:hypothetical protein [Paracoccaceae bacterium]
MRTALRIAGITLLALVLAATGLFGWSEYQSWQRDRALAEAEAWNLNEWKTGEALKVTLAFENSVQGETLAGENTIHCYRKKIVYGGFGIDRPVRTEDVVNPLLYQSAFNLGAGDQYIRGISTTKLCRDLFRDGPPTVLPAALIGHILIMDLSDDTPALSVRDQTFRLPPRTCQVEWSTKAPLRLEGGVTMQPVQLLRVDPVPMREALAEPGFMGSANGIVDRMVNRSIWASDRPATYQWDQTALCWVATGRTDCIREADDICGIPRL